jgi:plastocyanin
MSRPLRSLRLLRRTTESLDNLSGNSGEIFYDSDNKTLRVFTGSGNDRSILATRSWTRENTFSGKYEDLQNKPVIPTSTSNLINDSNFVTQAQVSELINDIEIEGFATEEYVDNAVSNIEGSNQNLQDLSNVTISNVSDGQILKYNASTDSWVNASDLTGDGGSGISLSDLSVTIAQASGNGTLSYSNTTGIFTFTPSDLSSFITLNSISASGDISYNSSTGVISFNNTTGYITRAGISVTQAAASGNGSLVYSNSTGVLTYTPPDLSSVSGGTASNSFATIAVSGQSSVVADSTTDTLTLVAGTGISITTNASTDAITITSTGSGSGELNQNAFSNVAVSGQSTVEADSTTDTLTLAAGTGISITTNASTDTVTITSTVSSGATTFTGLSDSAGNTTDKFYLPAITTLSTTNNGASSYRFDQYGTADNPTVYAINGTTIAFNLNVAGHPFLIQTSGGANYNEGLTHVTTAGVVTTGSAAQGKTSGTLYWKIPISISGNYRYICSIHGAMVGTITIKDFSVI